MEVAPFSIFGDHIVIQDVEIVDPQFNYETHFVSSNIGDLLNRLQGNAGGNDAPTAKNGQPLKFEVQHFRLQGGKVRLGVGPTALVLPMPPIELSNLGTAEAASRAAQLAFAVMRSVTTSVVGATTQADGAARRHHGRRGRRRRQEGPRWIQGTLRRDELT